MRLPVLIADDRIYINQQLKITLLDIQPALVLIDIPQNGAKVATQWLHGQQSGYTVATRKRGNQWQDRRKQMRQT
jgi:hypothetical protein